MTSSPNTFDPSSTQSFGAIDAPLANDTAMLGLSAQDKEAILALPAGTALLLVLQGPATGARFLLDAEVTQVGRHPKADIFLDDVTVSRKHAQFLKRPDGGFTVRDSGSLNGTYVNKELKDEAALQAGDEVQIGKYRMLYQPSQAVAQ